MNTRLDVLLCEKGFVKSREKAKELIKSGNVSVDGKVINKPSALILDESVIKITNDDGYVSRGAYKLKHAIDEFSIDLSGKTCIDIGASTGGFTQVILNAGAAKVYAIDVGHEQLDETLKNDARVVSMEGINFRTLDAGFTKDEIQFASCDVSFISLKLILDKAYEILAPKSSMVCLIKPQFEAGLGKTDKHGVIKDKKVIDKVVADITGFCEEVGFKVNGLTQSPVKGGKGNTEYLVYITKSTE